MPKQLWSLVFKQCGCPLSVVYSCKFSSIQFLEDITPFCGVNWYPCFNTYCLQQWPQWATLFLLRMNQCERKNWIQREEVICSLHRYTNWKHNKLSEAILNGNPGCKMKTDWNKVQFQSFKFSFFIVKKFDQFLSRLNYRTVFYHWNIP